MSFSHYRLPGVRCLYNADYLSATTVANWLAEDALALFGNAVPRHATATSVSYRAQVDGRHVYLKAYQAAPWPRAWRDWWQPTAPRCLRVARRLLAAGLPTPTPLLAATFRAARPARAILVTDFCPDSQPLAAALAGEPAAARVARLAALATLLARFHRGCFRTCRNDTLGLLAGPAADGGRLWFVALEDVGRRLFPAPRDFVTLVWRAGREFYATLDAEARNYWLRACFDAALKQNIFASPSQQQWFLTAVLSRLRPAPTAGADG